MSEPETRAQKIWNLEGQRKTQLEIADEIGVSTKTIQRERKKPAYILIVENNEEMYEQGLTWMEESGKDNLRAEAVKERGRRSRSTAGIAKDFALANEAPSLTPDEQWQKDIDDQRKREFVYKEVLQILPWQWKRLDLFYMDRPYEHIDKDWTRPDCSEDI